MRGYCRASEMLASRARSSLEAYSMYVERVYGFSASAERLSSTLVHMDWSGACRILQDLWMRLECSSVCVLGPNTSIEGGLDCLLAGPEPAILHGLRLGRRLLYVTTDLDSSLRLLGMADYVAVYKLVHVHGDNHYRLPAARGWRGVVYTSQVEAPGVLPLGGFTDGDRAVITAMVMGARVVRVYGFNPPVYTGYKDYGYHKPYKLDVAMKIIRHVAGRLGYTMEVSDGLITLERRRCQATSNNMA